MDNKRIKIILKEIKKKSIKNKIDPKITNKIWINMIRAYIDYEKEILEKNNYLLWGGNFFYKEFVLSGTRVILFHESLTLAFSPPAGFFK